MMPPDALPLHLMLSMMQSASFPNALPNWNASFPNYMGFNPMAQNLMALNPFLPKPKSPLEQSSELMLSAWQNLSEQFTQAASPWLNAANQPPKSRSESPKEKSVKPETLTEFAPYFFQPNFLTALAEETYRQSSGFLEGLQEYLGSDYERPQQDYKVLWQRGSARLLDLAPERKDALAVFCVPSLINKSYVLDLYPDASFVQYLKSQGFRPLILDWGTPGDEELNFTTADYIVSYAVDALHELREQHEGPIALLGYCMGGIFTIAMTQLAQLFVDALVLLATPWDFSAPDTPRVLLEPTSQVFMRQWINSMNPVPPIVTQTIFHLINPWYVQEKYRDFPKLTKEERRHFLAVEQWVNDGVSLPQKVAEECFVDWPQGNMLANHQWKVGRRWIEPASITCPTLAVIPQRDAIVPKGVALPLTQQLQRVDTLFPEAGHVSMVAGKRAPEVLWKPVAGWLKARF